MDSGVAFEALLHVFKNIFRDFTENRASPKYASHVNQIQSSPEVFNYYFLAYQFIQSCSLDTSHDLMSPLLRSHVQKSLFAQAKTLSLLLKRKYFKNVLQEFNFTS